MPNYLPCRSEALSKRALYDFYKPDGHLAYRRTMLLAHYDLIKAGCRVEYVLIPAYEASLAATRMFIQFFGLWVKYEPLRLVEDQRYIAFRGRSHEVKIKDLGGKWVLLRDLTRREKTLLRDFCDGVSKTTAHFTYGSRHKLDWRETHDVVLLVDRFLKTHLYDVVGKTPFKKGWVRS